MNLASPVRSTVVYLTQNIIADTKNNLVISEITIIWEEIAGILENMLSISLIFQQKDCIVDMLNKTILS